MQSDEADCYPEPQKSSKKYKSIRNIVKRYYLIISVLFFTIIMLCIVNAIAYNSLNKVNKKYKTAFENLQPYVDNLKDLRAENEIIKKQYVSLKYSNQEIRIENEKMMKVFEDTKKKNEELSKENKELQEDNLALQSSLKTAASVGIKPKNYNKNNQLTSRGSYEKGRYIGKFLGTAYTPSADECGNNKGITNSGEPIIPGISIAIDNKYWPFGTVFYIKGLGYAVAMDTGSAIKGKNRFDFAVFDKKFAYALGKQHWDVYLVKLGDGNVKNIKINK